MRHFPSQTEGRNESQTRGTHFIMKGSFEKGMRVLQAHVHCQDSSVLFISPLELLSLLCIKRGERSRPVRRLTRAKENICPVNGKHVTVVGRTTGLLFQKFFTRIGEQITHLIIPDIMMPLLSRIPCFQLLLDLSRGCYVFLGILAPQSPWRLEIDRKRERESHRRTELLLEFYSGCLKSLLKGTKVHKSHVFVLRQEYCKVQLRDSTSRSSHELRLCFCLIHEKDGENNRRRECHARLISLCTQPDDFLSLLN